MAKVARIRIHNILGIDSLEIRPGQVTIVEGPNGVGKTSIIQAINSLLKAGHDATLLRKGEAEGQVVLVLDDGTTLTKHVGEDQSKLSAVHGSVGKVSAPKQFVDRLLSLTTLNPLEFAQGTPESRKRQILAFAAQAVDTSSLEKIVRSVDGLETSMIAASGWDAIKQADRMLASARAQYNSALAEQESTAQEILASVSDGVLPVEDARTVADAAERQMTEAQAKLSARIAQTGSAIEDMARTATEIATKEIDDDIAELADRIAHAEGLLDDNEQQLSEQIRAMIADCEQRIAAIRKDFNDRQEVIVSQSRNVRDRVRAQKNEITARYEALKADRAKVVEETSRRVIAEERVRMDEETQKTREAVEAIRLALERARGDLQRSQAAAGALAIRDRAEEKAKLLRDRLEKVAGAIASIEAMKVEALEKMPVKGLAPGESDLEWNGIPFHRLSEAERIEVAFRVAVASIPETGLRFVCVDGLESLDAERMDLVDRLARDLDVQLIGTRVTPTGELTIRA